MIDVTKRSVVFDVMSSKFSSLGALSFDGLEITPDRFSLMEKIFQSDPLFCKEMVSGMVVPSSKVMLPSSVPLFPEAETLLQNVFLNSFKELFCANIFRSFSRVLGSTCRENNCTASLVFPSFNSLKSLSAVVLSPDVARRTTAARVDMAAVRIPNPTRIFLSNLFIICLDNVLL